MLTLSGVLISNYDNSRRLRMQLVHDSAEKSKERITSIRREIYLRATDEALLVMRYFVRLPHVDLAETNPSDELQGFQSTLSKLKLVTGPANLSLVTSLDTECTVLFVKLLQSAQPVQDLRSEVTGLDAEIDFFDDQSTKTFAEKENLNQHAGSDSQQLAALMRLHESQLAKVAQLTQLRNAKQEELDARIKAYSKAIYSELTSFGRLLEQISIVMRAELGLTTDTLAYAVESERLRIEMGALVDRTLDSMHSSK